MASAVQISVVEYLQTSYRPDCEYVDGELRERHVGKWDHARVQALLAGWFMNHETLWGVMAATEQRVQVSPTRVRIPDLAVIRPGRAEQVLTDPPLLVVEILSLDDSYSDTLERAEDYLKMGVETIWIIDPRTRTAKVCRRQAWVSATRLEVEGTPIYVEIDTIFGRLNESY